MRKSKRIAVLLLTGLMLVTSAVPTMAQDNHDHDDDNLYDSSSVVAVSDDAWASDQIQSASDEAGLQAEQTNDAASSLPEDLPGESTGSSSSQDAEASLPDDAGRNLNELPGETDPVDEDENSEEEMLEEDTLPESYVSFYAEARPFQWRFTRHDSPYVWSTIGGLNVTNIHSGANVVVASNSTADWTSDVIVYYAENGTQLYSCQPDGSGSVLMYEAESSITHIVGNEEIVWFIEGGMLKRLHVESGVVDDMTAVDNPVQLYPYNNLSVAWSVAAPAPHDEDDCEALYEYYYCYDAGTGEVRDVTSEHFYLDAYWASTMEAVAVSIAPNSQGSMVSGASASSFSTLAKYPVSTTNPSYFNINNPAAPCVCHNLNGTYCTWTSRRKDCTCSIYRGNSMQCHGFAKTVFEAWYGFEMNKDYHIVKSINMTGSTTEEKLKNMPVGSLVRSNSGHSFMILSKTATHLTSYEANTGADDCKVFSRTMSFKDWASKYSGGWEYFADGRSSCSHSWTAATCTTPRTCKTCKVTSGTKLGHNYGKATCASPAKCTRCPATNGKPLEHSYAAATCTKPRTCKNCNATSGSSLGHDWSAATCTSAKRCRRCNTTSGSPLGHNLTGKIKTERAATCTSTGIDLMACTRPGCSHRANVTTKALGHNYATRVGTPKAPTCTASGTGTFKCTRCTSTQNRTVGALGHSFTVAATCTRAKKCSRCTATTGSALGHSYTVPATCTRAKKCSRCTSTTGSALGHAMIRTGRAKNPTCTATGLDNYRCSRNCGYTQQRSVAALGHNYKAATCTQPRTCTRCGHRTGSALGHNYSVAATCTRARKCSRCSSTTGSPLGHSWQSLGNKKYKCRRCNATKTG